MDFSSKKNRNSLTQAWVLPVCKSSTLKPSHSSNILPLLAFIADSLAKCWCSKSRSRFLQSLLRRLCWQMLVPPQSLQLLLRRLCWQMLVPPQSLHLLLRRLCSHFFSTRRAAPPEPCRSCHCRPLSSEASLAASSSSLRDQLGAPVQHRLRVCVFLLLRNKQHTLSHFYVCQN